MTDKYAVLGNPIKHSLSPQLHALFAEQTGEDMAYDKQLIDLDHFDEQVNDLVAQGYKGFNVTVPFKEDAYRWVSQPSPDTAFAGALNTIKINEKSTQGFSTDGVGLVRDLTQNLNIEIAGKRVLLLGAGGAAKSVIPNLIQAEVSQLIVANRTVEKAEMLAKKLPLTPSSFEDLEGHFDLVINATAASLAGEALVLPEGLIDEKSFCYEMMYNAGDTPFIKWSNAANASSVDGLGMLVEQGAESFYIWRGVRPETSSVISSLK